VTEWESRCYFDGIPDEVPGKLAKSLRVPNYKSIAMCILNNDHLLKGLGFSGMHSKYYDLLKHEEMKRNSNQINLW
jgi:predicted phosphoadenosine phosphosulfate sulfurtransferase